LLIVSKPAADYFLFAWPGRAINYCLSKSDFAKSQALGMATGHPARHARREGVRGGCVLNSVYISTIPGLPFGEGSIDQ
jgi:hypothetical protein